MQLSDVRIEKGTVDGHKYVAIRLPERMRTLSSTILNGGLGSTDSVLMLQVSLHYDHADPVEDMRSMVKKLDLPADTVCFMTAAELDKAFCAREVEHNGSRALALLSAGISNAIRAGESSREGTVPHRQVGTINIMVITDRSLDDCGLVNAVMTVTEAKAAALQDHHIPGTGTTSDAVLVACPLDGERCLWSGSSSEHGIAMSMAVREGLGESIARWKGVNGDSVHFLRHLAIRGITYDDMWAAVKEMNALDPAWDEEMVRRRFEAKLENPGQGHKRERAAHRGHNPGGEGPLRTIVRAEREQIPGRPGAPAGRRAAGDSARGIHRRHQVRLRVHQVRQEETGHTVGTGPVHGRHRGLAHRFHHVRHLL